MRAWIGGLMLCDDILVAGGFAQASALRHCCKLGIAGAGFQGVVVNIVKILLSGAGFSLAAITTAMTADLRGSPEGSPGYVRICNGYGEGFFQIPGTSSCIRLGGRARMEYQYTGPLKAEPVDRSGFRAIGRLQIDARTGTEWGALRTFVRFEIASRTGGSPLHSGTVERMAQAFGATGIDTYGRAQKYVAADKAFIQFAGLTAGRFSSFFDFYGHELELIGAMASSEVQSTNGVAWTAKLGNGFSATVSLEDPTFRRNPIFTSGNTGPVVNGGKYFANVGAVFDPQTGMPVAWASVDSAQRLNAPDIVAVLRHDSDWGAAQLSAAAHQISVGPFMASSAAARRPNAVWGYALQGGVKLNLPAIAAGDQLWLQGAFARGAMSYTGLGALMGSDTLVGQSYGRFSANTADAYVSADGDITPSRSWSVVAAYLHYWTPALRQAVFASYGRLDYGSAARGVNGPLYAGLGGALVPPDGHFSAQQLVNWSEAATLRGWGLAQIGANLVWSPVKGLDIGAEVSFVQIIMDGRVRDMNRNSSVRLGGVDYARTARTDYAWQGRLRLQRDF